MLRSFILFVLAAFGAMLLMAAGFTLLGVARPPLTGGVGWAALDVLLYASLTLGAWWILTRRLRR